MSSVSSVSSTIDSLTALAETYSASASITDGVIDTSSSTVTGDRTTDLFDTSSTELGKEEFLTLLVTQLQYQDPLDPMDNTEFVAQLAQFSALESSTNIEEAIDDLGNSFESSVLAQEYSAQSMTNIAAVSLIGKEVCILQSTVEWDATSAETEQFGVHLGENDSAVVEIVDSNGEVIRTIEATDKNSENSVWLTWDGTTDEGTVAESGTYEIQVQGQDDDSELYVFAQDLVEGVRFSADEGALVKIAGQELSIGNVLDVSIASTTSSSGSSTDGGLSTSSVVALLGKQVRVRETSVTYSSSQSEPIAINVEGGSRQSVQLKLTDSSGDVVYSTSALVDDDGIARFEWNGITSDGTYADAGEYTINLVGEDSDASLYAFSEGIVSGIANLNGAARLRVGNSTISLSDIIAISDAGTEADAV